MTPVIEHLSIAVSGGTLAILSCGAGETVAMIPSWARGASDFHDLAVALADAGFRAVAVNPRGIEGSVGSLDQLTARRMAADVGEVIEAIGAAPAHVLGHALGNGVARCLATDRPDLVKSVILLAAGGLAPSPPGALEALQKALTQDLSDADWTAAMHDSGFFAPGVDPMVWRDGWWRETALAHQKGFLATPTDHWWAAGTAPLLVIQGLQDKVAVPENGWRMRDQFGDRIRVVDLEGAAHALLPEQPAAIARAVIDYLAARRG